MILVYILVALLPFYRYPFLPPDTIDVIKYAGIFALLYSVIHVLRRGQILLRPGRIPPLFRTPSVLWYLCFLILLSYSYFRVGSAVTLEYNPLLTQISLLGLLCILFSVLHTWRRTHSVLLVAIGSVALGGMYLLREWYAARGWATGYRAGWLLGDDEVYAAAVATLVPLAWCLSRDRCCSRERWFCLGCIAIMLTAVVVGGSRGGLLGTAAALLANAWNSRRRVRNATIVVGLLLVLNVAYPHSPLRRLLDPSDIDRSNANTRLVQLNAGIAMIRDYPLFGVGLGRFKSVMDTYAPAGYDSRNIAHNAFLSVAAEMGLPALLAFVGMWVSVYRGLNRTRRIRGLPPGIDRLIRALQASLIGGAVSVCFINGLYIRAIWFVVFLAMWMPWLATTLRNQHRELPGMRGTSETAHEEGAACVSWNRDDTDWRNAHCTPELTI